MAGRPSCSLRAQIAPSLTNRNARCEFYFLRSGLSHLYSIAIWGVILGFVEDISREPPVYGLTCSEKPRAGFGDYDVALEFERVDDFRSEPESIGIGE